MIIVYNGTSTSQQKGVGAKPFPFNQLGGGRCKEAIIFWWFKTILNWS